MKIQGFLRRMPENAVFWLLLFSIAFGSAASLYGKITDKAKVMAAPAEYYVAPAANAQSVISINDSISAEPLYPCQIFRPEVLR